MNSNKLKEIFGNQHGVERKFDKFGRISIPKDYLSQLNFSSDELVELQLYDNAIIILKKVNVTKCSL